MSLRSRVPFPVPASLRRCAMIGFLITLSSAGSGVGAPPEAPAFPERARMKSPPTSVFHPATHAWERQPGRMPTGRPEAGRVPPLIIGSSESPAQRSAQWTFTPNVRPHPETNGQHLWPDLAAHPSGLIGAAWMDDHAAGGYHIFYSASSDGGVSWTTPERVDDRAAGAYSKFVDLEFTPSGVPVAVWEDDRDGNINLYLSKRDGGAPWSANVRVNTAGSPPGGSYYMNASLAILDEGRFFVAWTDWREGVFNQVYTRSSRDGGVTWGPETRISDEIGYEPLAGSPCLLVDPASGPTPGEEILYCAMDDWRGYQPGGRYPDVYFSRSTDGGATWSNGLPVNDITDYYQQGSSHSLVLLSDGTLTCGWLSNDWSLSTFRTCLSTDAGRTWSPSVRVDDPALGGCGTYSSIAASGLYVFAGMDAYQGSWDATLRVSPDGGQSWPDPQVRMDDDESGAASGNTVVAAVSPSEVLGIWQDTRPGTGNWKIYATRGTRDLTAIASRGAIVPGASAALRVVPNPSRLGSAVEILAGGWVSSGNIGPIRDLEIYDLHGRRLRTLPATGSRFLWDGRSDSRILVPGGLYLARLRGSTEASARILRLPQPH